MSKVGFLLQTQRLGLRPFKAEDLDDLESMLGDAETMKYYPNPFTREMCSSWIEDNRRRYQEDGFGLWAIEELMSGEFLGDCGPARRFIEGVWMVELGWHVKRSRWRQGIASEAALASKAHAFGTLGVPKLVSLIRPVNIPSRGLASRIGMSIEREVRYKNHHHLLYSVGREPSA